MCPLLEPRAPCSSRGLTRLLVVGGELGVRELRVIADRDGRDGAAGDGELRKHRLERWHDLREGETGLHAGLLHCNTLPFFMLGGLVADGGFGAVEGARARGRRAQTVDGLGDAVRSGRAARRGVVVWMLSFAELGAGKTPGAPACCLSFSAMLCASAEDFAGREVPGGRCSELKVPRSDREVRVPDDGALR